VAEELDALLITAGGAMREKSLLVLASSLELVTGLVAIAAPSLLADVLFSAGLTSAGKAIGRVCGFALISLAIACWPRHGEDYTQATRALFLYNVLAFCYLGYLRIVGEFSSSFLLPICLVHGLLTLLFVRPVYEGAIERSDD
jgi:hypothetical protein